MSRYVDLDGNTWDGKPITSKIQEVETKHGYMSAITTGWLFSESVPYLDIEKHDAKIRTDERKRFAEWCKTKGYSCYDWRMLFEQYEEEQKI